MFFTFVLTMLACEKHEPDPPTPPGAGQNGTNPYGAGNGAVTFYCTPGISVTITSFTLGGTALGGFSQFFTSGSPTCGQDISGVAITSIRPAGTYDWCATRVDGSTYRGTVTIPNGSCVLRGIFSGDMGACSGGGSSTCNWIYMPSCFQVTTGNPDGHCDGYLGVRVTNNCSQSMAVYWCLRRANGTWDAGMRSSLSSGNYDSYWTCESTGQYKVYGILASTLDNCNGQPDCN